MASPPCVSLDVFYDGHSARKFSHTGYKNMVSPLYVLSNELQDNSSVIMTCHINCIDMLSPTVYPQRIYEIPPIWESLVIIECIGVVSS